MTDRVPAPSTEAGREQLAWCDRIQYDDRNRERIIAIEREAVEVERQRIIEVNLPAIEQQARAEGRREAVRRIQADNCTAFEAGCVDDHLIIHGDLLDRVAGLEGEGRSPEGSNASESAPPRVNWPMRPPFSESPPTEERRAHPASRRITGSQGREARRDASESAPTFAVHDPACLIFRDNRQPGDKRRCTCGDASESPPTEPKCLRCGALWVHQDDYAGLGTPHPYESAEASESGQPPDWAGDFGT